MVTVAILALTLDLGALGALMTFLAASQADGIRATTAVVAIVGVVKGWTTLG